MRTVVSAGDPVDSWNGGAYYATGARCTHKGLVWRATLDICNPAFEPGGYTPYGWEEVPRNKGLAADTTRQQYHVQLAESYARSAPHGGNMAILAHLNKVARMSDEEWAAHRDGLLAAVEQHSRSGVLAELVQELGQKRRGE